jgi:hypothetical protein
VTKTASAASAEVGETITYTYRVTNTGDVTLDSVAAYDDKLGEIKLDATSLSPGVGTSGALTHTIVEVNLPGPVVTADASFVLALSKAGGTSICRW